jgi:hypothetical protein
MKIFVMVFTGVLVLLAESVECMVERETEDFVKKNG